MKDLGKEQIGEVDDGEVNAASQYEEAMATAGPKNRPGGVRPLLAVAGVLVVVIAAFFGWRYLASRSSGDEPGDQAPVVVRVSTAKAERGSISREVSAVGTITAARQSVVSANAPGQVRGLGILQNKFVKQGDLLARVNTTDLEAQKREAEAALREARLNIENLKRSAIPQSEIQARKDLRDAKASVDNAKNLYERRKDLYEKGGISLKDLEAARLALTQAENNLSYLENSNALRTGTSNSLELKTTEARAAQAEQRIKTLQTQISLADIRAPISGIVVEQTIFDGEYATPGGKVLTIADISEVIVKASFPDSVVPDIKEGDPVIVRPNDLPGESMAGKVSLVSRSTDPASRATEIWVRLANGAGRLRTGGSADVVISENTVRDAIVVPDSAVVLDEATGRTGVVFVVDPAGIAHEKKVEIGIRNGRITQIVKGIAEGETVITEGNYALPDGTKVSVRNSGQDASGAEE